MIFTWLLVAATALLLLWWWYHPAKRKDTVRKIVYLRPETSLSDARQLLADMDGRFIRQLPLVGGILCELPRQNELTLLSAGVGIRQVDDDLEIHAIKPLSCWKYWHRAKSQPRQELPWGIQKLQAAQVWPIATGKHVKVAVVDTGIDFRHRDLQEVVVGGYNTLGGHSHWDDNGHGTHVAGIITANNNEVGVVGVAPEAELYAVKVLDSRGSGNLSDLVDALQWCLENDVKVVNLSLGAARGNETLRLAIKNAVAAGMTILTAVGNDGPEQDTVNYPAKYPETIAVAASTQDDGIADFSSRGLEVDLAAPGEQIHSTWPLNRYKTLSGSSMACPHVTGLVALIKEVAPELTPAEIAEILKSTAEPLAGPTTADQGAGLVNASKAVEMAQKTKEENENHEDTQ